MKRKFIHDISANTLQVIINQCCGLGIFFVLSTYLGKNDFGEINWSLAVLLTIYGILACGVDQVSVKKVASGEEPKKILSIYLSHVLLWGLLIYGLLVAGALIFHSFFQQHYLLLLLAVAKLMIFFSTPFKQLATGLERFRPLLYMSVCSNVARSIALLLLAGLQQLTLTNIVIIFIAGDLAELLVCILVTQRAIKVPVILRWNKKGYSELLRESFPQLGVAIFTSVIARFDWIFLGLFVGTIVVADYSFAYKVFEMATLPMLIIAPVLIPRFTKIFHPSAEALSVERTNDLFVLLRIEMMIASLTALVLNILWVPVIDLITAGKYGAVNRYSILFLSVSMPFLYLNNFLWTINFAKGRLKMIFYNFGITFCINIVADIILIPLFKAEGAAVGYLLAIVGQSIFYLYQTRLAGLEKAAFSVLLCPIAATTAGFAAAALFRNTWAILSTAIFLYLFFLFISRQLRRNDFPVLRRVTGF